MSRSMKVPKKRGTGVEFVVKREGKLLRVEALDNHDGTFAGLHREGGGVEVQLARHEQGVARSRVEAVRAGREGATLEEYNYGKAST